AWRVSWHRMEEKTHGHYPEHREEERAEEMRRGGRGRPAGPALREQRHHLVRERGEGGEAAEDAGDREELELRGQVVPVREEGRRHADQVPADQVHRQGAERHDVKQRIEGERYEPPQAGAEASSDEDARRGEQGHDTMRASASLTWIFAVSSSGMPSRRSARRRSGSSVPPRIRPSIPSSFLMRPAISSTRSRVWVGNTPFASSPMYLSWMNAWSASLGFRSE